MICTDPGGPLDFDADGNSGILDMLTVLANWGRVHRRLATPATAG